MNKESRPQQTQSPAPSGQQSSLEEANPAATAEAFIASARTFLSEEYLPKIERCLEQLSEEDVWWRGAEESNSIGNLILHLSGNARQWIVSGVGGAPDTRARQQEFDRRAGIGRAELLATLRDTLAEVDAVLQRVDPARLQERRSIQGHDVTIIQAIFHVVEHFAMHTGQIILLTKLLAKKDLAFYDFSSGAPAPTWRRD
ncbi:MAG TPA: DinB family protein [Pyrinomonadaceae bacterium]|jgi:uncharacterized damage-inducible protein DinB|nr:DinB family protein [Pyrinomonadaceae bacterium]